MGCWPSSAWGGGQCVTFSPWWALTMQGGGHEGWWHNGDCGGKRVVFVFGDCVCVCLWVVFVFDYELCLCLLMNSGKDQLRLVRPVFYQSWNFQDCERPKTGPLWQSWEFLVLGSLGPVQSQSFSVLRLDFQALIYGEMEADKNNESCVNHPWHHQIGHNKCTKLWRWHQISSKDASVCWCTSIPSKARTVSLLASFALRSPTSPVPLSGVVKCKLMEALELPTEMAQRDLNDALRHNAATHRPGKKRVSRRGEIVSRITAVSLSMLARSQYFFASGASDEPNMWAATMAACKN